MINGQKTSQRGQAAVEYVLLLTLIGILLFSNDLDKLFLGGIDSYFHDIAALQNLPIP